MRRRRGEGRVAEGDVRAAIAASQEGCAACAAPTLPAGAP
jgi:hypothetical protein